MPGQLTEQMEGVRKQLETRWQIEAEALNKSWFSSQGQFNTALAKLNSKYQQEELKVFSEIQQQEESRQRIQELIAGPSERSRAEEVDIRLELEPEAERLVFPEQRDPRDEYREIRTTKDQVFQDVQQFVRGKDGKLYRAKEEKEGTTWYLTDQPDKNQPASQQEEQAWVANMDALYSLRQAGVEAAQNMVEMGMEDPNRLENRMRTAEEDHWLKRAAKGYYALTGPGLISRGVKRIKTVFAPDPKGTFAQKVGQTLPQERQRRKPASRVIKQRNKHTGQERISYDGGKTWQMSG